jgi:predicted ATPase
MLTRIEIDGFKTFEGLRLDLSPFVVVLGPNASGKSNLFDAIRLLSRLAAFDVRTAFRDLRGEPHELFRRQPDGTPGRVISLAVETLFDPQVMDPWGGTVDLEHTRVRYEVTIERRSDKRGIERLVIASETARPLFRQDDEWTYAARASESFRQRYLRY